MIKFTKTLFFIIVFTFNLLKAQDIILKKNGDEIKAKIVEISPTEIKYKAFENLEGPLFVIYKSDVFMIKYLNGTKDVFTETEPIKPKESQPPVEVINKPTYAQGENDAYKYYINYKGAGTGNFVGGLLLGIFSLPIPIATGATPPNEFNLGYPNKILFQDSDYRAGYLHRAKKIKQNKVWSNWAYGCVTGGTLSLLLQFAITSRR